MGPLCPSAAPIDSPGGLYLPLVLQTWDALKCVQFSFSISVRQVHLTRVVSRIRERRQKH